MGKYGTYKVDGIAIAIQPFTTGNIFFVDSGNVLGDDSPSSGDNPNVPFSTIDYAISQVTASNGDEIHVMAGHAETMTDASLITMDVIGVSIIGHGTSANKPTLTMSETASGINVTAADCQIKNIRFVSSVDSVLNFISLGATGQIVEDCDFVTGTATEALAFIDITTTYDNITIKGCTFLQPTDPNGTGAAVNTGGVYLVDSENVLIEDCTFRGQFESGIVHNKTTACKGLVIRNTELSNELTVPLLLVTTAEGVADGCYGASLVAATANEADVWGTIGTIFWIAASSSLGNDSGGGGQLAAPGTAVCS